MGRLFRILPWPILVLVGLAWVFLDPRGIVRDQNQSDVASTPIGGAFDLVDQSGRPVTDQGYKTPYKLIFFGFTSCPSICPSELLKMSDILSALQSPADRVTPIFITIDPARDTPEKLKNYTAKFDARIIGLTGSQAQIDQIVHRFRAYAARVETPQGYTMDHSAFLYLTDADNYMVAIYKIDQTADEIAADIKKRID